MNEIRHLRLNKQTGAVSLAVFALMAFFAVALPFTTKLVQQNQENRSKAVMTNESDGGGSTNSCTTTKYPDVCSGGVLKYCSTLKTKKTVTCPYGCRSDGKACASAPAPVTPTCTYSYGSWGACDPTTRTQKRQESKSPSTCTGGNRQETSQSCTPPPPQCTDWTYSAYSACSSSGTQTRSVTGQTPSGCTGTAYAAQVTSNPCTPPPQPCTGYNYDGGWTTCSSGGRQSGTYSGYTPSNCTGIPSDAPKTQSCTPPVVTVTCDNWTYSDWTPTTCDSSGKQTRSVTGKTPAGCTTTPYATQITSSSCIPPVPVNVCTPNATKCMDNNISVDKCKTDGSAWIVNWDDCTTTEECKVVGFESKCVAKSVTVCTDKQTRCANSLGLETCNSTKTGWTLSSCPWGCDFSTNACKPAPAKICTPNTQYNCDGRNLNVCKSDGSGWTLYKECGIDQTCNSTTKSCVSKTPTLNPTNICIFGQKQCSEDLSGYKYCDNGNWSKEIEICMLGCNKSINNCNTTTVSILVTQIILNPISINSITVGKSQKILATVSPATATNKELSWSSSDGSIASVDLSGNIKAIKPGNTTIKVSAKDEGKIEIKINVTVVTAPVTTSPSVPTDQPQCQTFPPSSIKPSGTLCLNSKVISQPVSTGSLWLWICEKDNKEQFKCTATNFRDFDASEAIGPGQISSTCKIDDNCNSKFCDPYSKTCNIREGGKCELDRDCSETHKCIDGKCKIDVAVGTGNGGLNTVCNVASDCKSPYVCYSEGKVKVCKVKSGGHCDYDSDCYSNHFCNQFNHQCKNNTNNYPSRPTVVDCTQSKGECRDNNYCQQGGEVVPNSNCASTNPVCCKISTPIKPPIPVKICTTNSYKCDGRNLNVCKSDGSGWKLSKECGIDQTCNASTKSCVSKTPTDTPKPSCNSKGGVCVSSSVCENNYSGKSISGTNCNLVCCDKTIPKTSITTTINIPISSISLNVGSPLKLKVGDSRKIIVINNPTNATNKTVYWSSNASSVASVDMNGNIKTLKPGTATITVKSIENNNVKASVEIIIETDTTPTLPSCTSQGGSCTSDLECTANTGRKINNVSACSSKENICCKLQIPVIEKCSSTNCSVCSFSECDPIKLKGCVWNDSKCVNKISATGISVDKRNVTVEVGKTVRVTATISPNTTTDNYILSVPELAKSYIEYKKDDKVIEIRGVKAGTVIITVGVGSYNTSFTVVVKDFKPKCSDEGGICVNNLFTCGDKYSGKVIEGTDCASVCCKKLTTPSIDTTKLPPCCGLANGKSFSSESILISAGLCNESKNGTLSGEVTDTTSGWKWYCKSNISANGTFQCFTDYCTATKTQSSAPVTTFCADQKGVCQQVGECKAENGSSLGKLDCTGTNVCCKAARPTIVTCNPNKDNDGNGVINSADQLICRVGGGGGGLPKYIDDCDVNGAVCRPVCSSQEHQYGTKKGEVSGNSISMCKPGLCCKINDEVGKVDGVCNPDYHLKTLKITPLDSKACSAGNLSWININGLYNLYSWKCTGLNGGQNISCEAYREKGFGGECKRDQDCQVNGLSRCVDNRCMTSGGCVSTKINTNIKLWMGNICFNNKQYTCNNTKNSSNWDFWNFSEINCPLGCDQNGVKCIQEGWKCDGNFREHWTEVNQRIERYDCGSLGCNSQNSTCNIGVKEIRLNKNFISLLIGKTEKINVTIDPINSTDQIIWSSSNENIVKVSNNGLVEAVKEGTSTVTATTNNGKKADLVVKVTTYNMCECGDAINKTYKNTLDDKPQESLCKNGAEASTPVIDELSGSWNWQCLSKENLSYLCNKITCQAPIKGGKIGSIGLFCKTDIFCESKFCVFDHCTSGGISSPCIDNMDCATGNKCNLSTKKCVSGDLGFECNQNFECDSGICASNKCAISAKNCSYGLFGALSDKHGTSSCGGLQENNGVIYCDNGKYKTIENCEFGCNQGKCLEGQDCIDVNEGTALKHNDKFCKNKSSDSGDDYLISCQNGVLINNKCPFGCKNGICQLGLGAMCNSGRDCMSGVCKDNFCAKSSLYDKCTKPSDCETNNCNFGVCLTPGSKCDPEFTDGDNFWGCKPNQSCRSTSGVDNYKCITDGKCGVANNKDGRNFPDVAPPTKEHGLCEKGDNSPVVKNGSKFTWSCTTKDSGSKPDNCTADSIDGCRDLKYGEQKCNNYNTLSICDENKGLITKECLVPTEGCINNECRSIPTPKNPGDFCDNKFYIECPNNLSCVNHKCITKIEEQRLINQEKNKIPCSEVILKKTYVSGTIFSCEKENESCNMDTGLCESAPAVKYQKKAGDSCDSNLECLSGFCETWTPDQLIYYKDCSSRTQEEQIDVNNSVVEVAATVVITAATYGVGQALSGIAVVQKISTAIAPIISGYKLIKITEKGYYIAEDIIDGGDFNSWDKATSLVFDFGYGSTQKSFGNVMGTKLISGEEAVGLFYGTSVIELLSPTIKESTGNLSGVVMTVMTRGANSKYIAKDIATLVGKELNGENPGNPIDYSNSPLQQNQIQNLFDQPNEENTVLNSNLDMENNYARNITKDMIDSLITL